MATRDFKKIPGASEPGQATNIGKRNQDIDKFLADQVESPEIADAAKQTYTQQQVQQNELLSGSTLQAPTTVGQASLTAPTITGATPASATTIAQPTNIAAGQMTAAQGTAQTGTAAQGTVGTQSQVTAAQGTLSAGATPTGATATPTTNAIAQAAQGQLSSGALAQSVNGTAATVHAQVAAMPTTTLVSAQLQTLLQGIETGTIPTWARAAVDAVDAQLAQRGMSRSSVGRDALINSIIQSAIPIAQANSSMLQQT